jgi:hypothetical protein
MHGDMERRQLVGRFVLALMACCTLATATGSYAADTSTTSVIEVEGTEQTDKMGTVMNLGATAVKFIVSVVAKVIGVGIAVWAITDLVRREVMWGSMKLFLCGACFFLEKLISSLAAMGGT